MQNDVVEQLMKAHFLDGADSSDHVLLYDIAHPARLREGSELMQTGVAQDPVRELLLIGKARGIATSPTLGPSADEPRTWQSPADSRCSLVLPSQHDLN
ncbi:hypothetical protein ABZX77_28960 [Streptomyces sp. NPDC004237]|uniref:hypothetical protein n=1 Tax=Streptomyces sp. NPDC004237 TaxID=3154455 RepID=UPI0033B1C8E3